jgi:TolB-like protein
MDTRREPLIITALVAGLVGLGSSNAAAQGPVLPTVTVMAFDGPIPAKTRTAMADELAARLQDTGRFRVLAREWLRAAPDNAHPSLAAARTAARSAGVQYLVLGEARVARSAGPGSRAVLCLEVRLVSVATGEVVRTAVGRTSSPPAPVKPVFAAPRLGQRGHAMVVGTLAGTAIAARAVARRRASGVPTGWERVIDDIARSIRLLEGGSS